MTKPALDKNALNPAGTARRRLIKAVGLGAVAASIGIDWQKPSIRLGGLPAHAQATTTDCTMFFSVTADVTDTSPGSYTLALVSEMQVTASTTWTGASQASLSTQFVLPASDSGSSYFWRVDHSEPSGSSFAFDWSGECCDFTASGRQTLATNQIGGSNLFQASLSDVGVCGFGLSVLG